MAYALTVSEPPSLLSSMLAQMAHTPSSYGNRNRGNILYENKNIDFLSPCLIWSLLLSAQPSKTEEVSTEPLRGSASWGHPPSRLVILDHSLWEGQ